MAAWFTTPIRVRGVVSYYGPVDLTEAFKHPPRPDPLKIRSVEEALLGAPLEQMPERYADASTITHIRAGTTPLVPTLLVYGGRDHIVEPKYGSIVVEALRARGTPVAYLRFRGRITRSMRYSMGRARRSRSITLSDSLRR
jgi:dipeptidyl aminopeptidase/acylaminoacyl peptidase